jgi:biopolymer transport protein ExbB
MWSEIAIALKNGDPYAYIIIFLAWVGFVLMFERFIMLQFVLNLDFKKFTLSFRKLVQAEDIDRAISLCKRTSRTSLPHISMRALEAAESDPTTVRGVIEEESIDFLPRIENRLNLLPTIATIVLLVGVLGTIDRLWSAFHAIDILDTADKQASLAGGIASSLTHAALSLMVCCIMMGSHHVLKGMALKLIDRIHYGVAVLTNLLAAPESSGYMPAMMPMMGAQSGNVAAGGGPSALDEQVSSPDIEVEEDAFNDAAIENIKDEEEII